MTRKSSYEVFSLRRFGERKPLIMTCELFRATKYPEITSLVARYEVFPLHQDIFSSEGRVWNLFG